MAWGTLAAFAVLAVLNVVRLTLWTYGADTGTFAQIVGDAFGGMRNGIEQGTHFRYHWSPALVLVWPFLALTHSALALQLVQVAASVATAPLLYALAVPRTGARIALRLAILALVYPPFVAIGWGEFHEVGLLAPLVLGMLLAADRRAWRWFAGCVAVLVTLREDVCVEIAVVGIALGIGAWRSRRAWFGAAAAATASLAIYYRIVVPLVGPWAPAHFYVYPFAGGPLALALAPLLHPLAFAAAIGTFGRLTYLLEVFVPLAFLPLRSRWVLAAAPGLAIVLLANDGLVYHMGNHYAALWVPWLLAATAFALGSIRETLGERGALRWTNAALGLCVVVLIFFNPLHPLHFLRANYHDLGAAQRALACVPAGASVATHDEWFSHIAAHNRNATLATAQGVDYLVYADDFPNDVFRTTLLPQIRAQVAAGRYREICRFGAVAAYERKGRAPKS